MSRRDSVSQAVVQPLSSAPQPAGPVRRRDWTARTRDTALNALRYSRFVTVMKRALPVTAAALIAVVVIYSFIPRQSDKMSMTWGTIGKVDNDLAMLKPKLTGADRKGRPFVVTADAAIQDGTNMKRVRLKNVQADFTMEKNRWLNANAAQGFVDMDKNTLTLTGGIAVFSDDGYELHTARANVDLKKGAFAGPSEVTGQGPSGALRADTFRFNEKTQRLELDGNVRMTIATGHK